MSFWKTLFGTPDDTPQQEGQDDTGNKQFDLMKYDGIKALRMGQADYAVKCLEAALDVHDDLETRDYLQQALIRTGQLQQAIGQLKVMAEAQPDNTGLWMQMAHVAYMDEDYDTMLEACNKAEQLEPGNGQVQLLYGRRCHALGDMVGAVARLTKAVSLDEELGDARLLRAQTLLRMGDCNGADEDARWLEAHTDGHEDVLLLRARIELALGHAEQAIEAYGRVIEANPFHTDAYRERGRVRYESGDKDGAAQDMEKLMELNPDEVANIDGHYSAEGIEQKTRQAYSNLNPYGINW